MFNYFLCLSDFYADKYPGKGIGFQILRNQLKHHLLKISKVIKILYIIHFQHHNITLIQCVCLRNLQDQSAESSFPV